MVNRRSFLMIGTDSIKSAIHLNMFDVKIIGNFRKLGDIKFDLNAYLSHMHGTMIKLF
jgi:hypothetical protein